MPHKPDRDLLLKCFLEAREEFSVDRVIADPELNRAFIASCRESGLEESACELNRALMNLRKASWLRGLNSKRTEFLDQDNYAFAAEIAIRILERREESSLDSILCDPELAEEFDRIASELSPGFSGLQYRWAALHLRKARKLKPELVAHAVPPIEVQIWPLKSFKVDLVPPAQGLYLFHQREKTLYIGEALNLRNRVGKHLDYSDNKHLARWLWQAGTDELFLETQVLAPETLGRVRKALESELIASRAPMFNVRP